MPDFIDRVGAELVRAASAEARPQQARPAAWRRLLTRTIRLRPLVIVVGLLVPATAAAVVSGVFAPGAPLTPKTAPIPTANEGGPIHSTATLLPLRAADPAGGLPWGLRMVRTTRGDVCLQFGRVAFGTIGALGQDGAFRDDHHFHPLSTSYLDSFDCANVDSRGNAVDLLSLFGVPTSAVASMSEGPAITGCLAERRPAPCPVGETRDLYFGLLGPDVVKLTYSTRSGRERTISTVGGDGAFLIVTRAHPGQEQGSGGEYAGLEVQPSSPLRAVTYRDGHTCRLSIYPCPEPGLVPVKTPRLSVAQLASPIAVRYVPARSYCIAVRAPAPGVVRPCGTHVPAGFQRQPSSPRSVLFDISFTARAPVTSSRSYYYVALFFKYNRRNCQESATSDATSSDIRAGQRLTFGELVEAGCHVIRGVVRFRPDDSGDTAVATPEPDPTDPGAIQVGTFMLQVP